MRTVCSAKGNGKIFAVVFGAGGKIKICIKGGGEIRKGGFYVIAAKGALCPCAGNKVDKTCISVFGCDRNVNATLVVFVKIDLIESAGIFVEGKGFAAKRALIL